MSRRGNLIPLFPKHLCCARNKDATVKEFLVGSQRNEVWSVELNRNLNEWEVREYMNFMETLKDESRPHCDRQTSIEVEFFWSLICEVLL